MKKCAFKLFSRSKPQESKNIDAINIHKMDNLVRHSHGFLIIPPSMLLCEECGTVGFARLVTGRKIYPHRKDLHSRNFFRCSMPGCSGIVSCHPDTQHPMGSLAGRQLRKLRRQCHKLLDALWVKTKENNYSPILISRDYAYGYLRQWLGYEAHVAMMNREQCIRLIQHLQETFY